MSIIKNVVDQVECHYCGQLSFVDDMTNVTVQDGPDDCIDVGMCRTCAEDYSNSCEGHEDDWKENDPQYG